MSRESERWEAPYTDEDRPHLWTQKVPKFWWSLVEEVEYAFRIGITKETFFVKVEEEWDGTLKVIEKWKAEKLANAEKASDPDAPPSPAEPSPPGLSAVPVPKPAPSVAKSDRSYRENLLDKLIPVADIQF